jgi:hypothetical protein
MAPSASRQDQLRNLYEMMERLGIEPGGGVVPRFSLTYATALHCCEACQFIQACREWLDSLPASVPFVPHFCPNTNILFELQVEQPGPAKWRTKLSNGGRQLGL